MHGWTGGLHWKVAVDGRPPGANGRFFWLLLSNGWTWITMGLDTQDERLCSMTSINKRNDSSLVFAMLVQHTVSAESWRRRDNGMASSWAQRRQPTLTCTWDGHVLRRRRARPAANLNRRGECGTPWVGADRALWLTGSAHMFHGSGGWVGLGAWGRLHDTGEE
jgi:hypothetical protein